MQGATVANTPNEQAAKEMTAAEAAKLVSREVPVIDKDTKKPVIKNGKVVTKFVPIKADEVFAFKDHGDYVNVVTVDGQKFRGDKKAA